MTALTPAEPTALETVSPETLRISLPLRRLLESDLPGQQEIAFIASDPNLHREARARADDLADVVKPAGEAKVEAVVMELLLHFRDAKDAAKASVWWKGYKGTLAGLPAFALERAVQDYIAAPDSEFFPKAGKLKELAEKHAMRPRQAAYRAKKAAELPPPIAKPMDPAEAERVRQSVREMLAKGFDGPRDLSHRAVKPA